LLLAVLLACGGATSSRSNPNPGGTPAPGGNSPPGVNTFAFVNNNASGSVSAFRFDEASGTLTPVASPLPVASDINLMAANPAGTVLFAPSRGANDVHSLQINPASGQLSEGFSTALTPRPYGIAVHPSGQFVYVSNQAAGSITVFRSDAVGNLTPIGPPTVTPIGVNQLAINPAGTLLIAPFDSGIRGSGGILTFSISPSTGQLTQAFQSAVSAVSGVAITPDGRFALVAAIQPERLDVFSIDASGALTNIGQPEALTGINRIAVTPDGRFAYALSFTANTITGFAIQPSGTLVPVPNATVPTGGQPAGLASDPLGKFVVVANSASNDLNVYSIAASGSLTQTGAPVPTGGSGPSWVVFVRH
jgi:6-phosphogluconolactonase (cycloisomerase 2 family)